MAFRTVTIRGVTWTGRVCPVCGSGWASDAKGDAMLFRDTSARQDSIVKGVRKVTMPIGWWAVWDRVTRWTR
jgi:hypothetical protein